MHLHLLTSFLFFLFFLLLPQTVTTFFSIKYFASHKNLAFASFLTNVLIKNDVRAQLDFFFIPYPLTSFLSRFVVIWLFLPYFFFIRLFFITARVCVFISRPSPLTQAFFFFFLFLSFHLEPVKKS